MPMSNLEYTSFLIRLWREPPASVAPEAAGREWLVQVEHIPGGEKVYLASLEELFAYIRGQLPGQHASKSAGEWRSPSATLRAGRGVGETQQ